MHNTFSKFIVFLCLSISLQVFAWGTTGHRVIAEIAENNLDARAKYHLKQLIGKQPLAYWANWPDFIKSDTTDVWKSTSQWHYVNIAPQTNFQNFQKELIAQPGPNLYTQIKALSAKIKDKHTSKADKEIALRFLVHLMGDLAQPMHVGRAEDLGGNRISLEFFGKKTNLHSLWDSGLVDFQQYSFTEYARVLDVKGRHEKRQIQSGTLEDWFYDSHKMANTIYAYSRPTAKYSYDYNYRFSALLERQLYYGGLRLAKVLNEVL